MGRRYRHLNFFCHLPVGGHEALGHEQPYAERGPRSSGVQTGVVCPPVGSGLPRAESLSTRAWLALPTAIVPQRLCRSPLTPVWPCARESPPTLVTCAWRRLSSTRAGDTPVGFDRPESGGPCTFHAFVACVRFSVYQSPVHTAPRLSFPSADV